MNVFNGVTSPQVFLPLRFALFLNNASWLQLYLIYRLKSQASDIRTATVYTLSISKVSGYGSL